MLQYYFLTLTIPPPGKRTLSNPTATPKGYLNQSVRQYSSTLEVPNPVSKLLDAMWQGLSLNAIHKQYPAGMGSTTNQSVFESVDRELVITLPCIHDAVYEQDFRRFLVFTHFLWGMCWHGFPHHKWQLLHQHLHQTEKTRSYRKTKELTHTTRLTPHM